MVLKLSKKVQFLKFCADLSKKYNQANIFWSSRRLEDVFKTWLQHVFSVTIFRLPRRLEDVLKTSLKTKKLLRWRRLEDALKTCLQAVFNSFRRQTKCLLGSVLKQFTHMHLKGLITFFQKMLYKGLSHRSWHISN